MRRAFWAALFLAVSAAPGFAAQVILSSTSVLPGQTLRVEVDGLLPSVKLRAVFLGKSYPFYVVGSSAQRALIGVPLGRAPGTYPLRIRRVTPPVKDVEAIPPVQVVVATRTYAIENVNFTPRKTALMAAERRESALIAQRKKHRSSRQWWEGGFSEPVRGQVIGDFGIKRLRNRTIEAGFHKGVDVRAPEGAPILAASGGTVLLAANFKAHGKTVLIDHGQGVMSIYIHMQKMAVRPGQTVRKGAAIGTVGQTGLATGPHLHWQVYVHGVPVDPQQWLENEF